MDEVAKYNAGRWRALVEAGALYTRPMLDLDEQSARGAVSPPVEYRHGLGLLVAGLTENGFGIERVSEDEFMRPDPRAEPGTWNHFTHYVRPWLTFLSRRTGSRASGSRV